MQLDKLEHTDIDSDSPVLHVTDADWDCFLHEYYRVVKCVWGGMVWGGHAAWQCWC